MSDKSIPFSDDELKEALSEDTGFRKLLDTLPINAADEIRFLATNPSLVSSLFKLLPQSYREEVERIFSVIFKAPGEATRLFHEARFFECRTRLLDAINIFQNKPETGWGNLDRAVHFQAMRAQALLYNLLAEVEDTLGNTETAGHAYAHALELAEETGDEDTMAKCRLGLGNYHSQRGDYQTALQYLEQSLRITENLHLTEGQPDRWRLRQKILGSLSALCDELGEKDRASEYAMTAIDLCEEQGDMQTLAVSMNNFGCLLMGDQNFGEAERVLEIALNLAMEKENQRLQPLILCNIAIAQLMQFRENADMETVRECLGEALRMAEETGSLNQKALAMHILGHASRSEGDTDTARDWYLDAVKIYRKIGARSDEAATLLHLGEVLKDDAGDLEGACVTLRQSIDIYENIRGRLKRETHRISFAESKIEPYAMIVDCLVRLGRLDEAFHYVERSKSRAMLDFLDARLRQEQLLQTDSEAYRRALEVLKEMDELRRNLEEQNRRREAPDNDEPQRAHGVDWDNVPQDLMNELFEKESSFQDAYARLSAQDPEKASLVGVMPIDINQILDRIGEGTLLLELYQTDKELLVFCAAQHESIKHLAIDLSISEASEFVWHTVMRLKESQTYDVRSHEYIREVRKPLSEMFTRLIRPLAGIISRYRRVIILPHLFWHYFPFHALINPEEKVYLCDMIEVGYCASASVLHLCMQNNRTGRSRALIMARNNGDLPHADREADLLAAAFHPDCCLYQGSDAHLGRVKEGSYDLLHLACHGEFNQDMPFLSGIDMPPDECQDRGAYLLDFFRMQLECNQVALSACNTGLSRFTSADELTGLSRGLFYAGAASVMLSLWAVPDKSTSYLMENYYWHYARNQQTKTRALQLAMQAVKAKPEYSHPHFWAPFVVMGDWR